LPCVCAMRQVACGCWAVLLRFHRAQSKSRVSLLNSPCSLRLKGWPSMPWLLRLRRPGWHLGCWWGA